MISFCIRSPSIYLSSSRRVIRNIHAKHYATSVRMNALRTRIPQRMISRSIIRSSVPSPSVSKLVLAVGVIGLLVLLGVVTWEAKAKAKEIDPLASDMDQ